MSEQPEKAPEAQNLTKNQRLLVSCRPARATDTEAVLDLTKNIWDGDDYVPHVWQDWLADPEGLLAVAEHSGRVLGLGKLTRLSEQDWWMEGLRVHPEYEGRGIASQLNDYLVEHWLQSGSGYVRLATSAKRLPVHHMCQRSGLEHILELTWYVAPASEFPDTAESVPFRPVEPDEVAAAAAYALDSPSLEWTAGLMDLFWRYAPPRAIYLDREVERQRAFWWGERRALLVFGDDEDDDGLPSSFIKLLACQPQDLPACLVDYCRLAAAHNLNKAGWVAPMHPVVLGALDAAGFKRDWDSSLYVFAREHPASSQRQE